MADINLSPPWYILKNQIAYTIGLSPGVMVRELVDLGYAYELPILVKNFNRAKAIRSILPSHYAFGNVLVIVNIYIQTAYGDLILPYSPITLESIDELMDLWCSALNGNPLYVGLFPTEKYVPPTAIDILGQVVIVVAKSVVQFYNDDISDLCENYNEVAATVFNEICTKSFLPNYKVSFTTFDKDCIDIEKLVCR